MANTKLPGLTGLSALAGGDLFYIVDVSDTTDSADGTSKKITATTLAAATETLTNKTIVPANNTITDAVADASTKGVSTYTAADFSDSSGTISLDYSNAQKASVSQAGFLTEVATAAETTTGTDAARAVSPDGLAGSTIFGVKTVAVIWNDPAISATTGTKKALFSIPAALNGMNLISVHAEVATAGTTNLETFDVNINGTTALSTKLTIDTGETGSDTAATPAVINTAADGVSTNDVVSVDVDAIHSTPAKGEVVTLEFQLP